MDNKLFKKNYDVLFYDVPDSPEVHEKYIVLYNVNNPENSIMLVDYKIESEKDLINFEKLFHSGNVKYWDKKWKDEVLLGGWWDTF